MKIARADAKRRAPKESGNLRKAIALRAGRRSRVKIGIRLTAGKRERLKIPAGAKGYYPHSIEYGFRARDGSFVPPRPFLRPAFDTNFRKIVKTAVQHMRRDFGLKWEKA